MRSQQLDVSRSAISLRPALLQRDWVIGLLLALLPLLPFVAETLAIRSFFYHDVQYYFFPYHKLVADLIHAGQLPLWNPYAFSGIPLLGDGQTAIFYPPNWLFLFLPTGWALNLVILLQFSIAGVGMWTLTRSLNLNRVPSLVAALSYMFSGFLTTRVIHLSIISGAALIPLLFWSVERFLQQRTLRRFAIAAVCIAVQAVAGHPQVPIYTAFALSLYVLVQAVACIWSARSWRPVLALVQLGGMYLAGYALAAIQLLPWFEFAALSPRAAGATYDFVTGQSIAPGDWWMWLFPYGWGGVQQNAFEPASLYINRAIYIWERAAYIGILPLILAIVGILSLLRPVVATTDTLPTDDPLPRPAFGCRIQGWALVVVLVVGGLIAAGHYTPFGHLVYLVPAMGKLRAYSRAIILVSFAACALAAYGAQRILVASPRDWYRFRPIVGMVVVVLAWLIGSALLLAHHPDILPNLTPTELRRHLDKTQPNGLVPLVLVVGSAFTLIVARRRWGQWLLVGLVALDLGIFATSFNPTAAGNVFDTIPASVSFLQRDPSLYRVATYTHTDGLAPAVAQDQLAISWSMAYGISSINGFNSLQPRRYTDLLFGPDVGDVSYGFLDDERLLQPDQPLLSLLNVKYVLQQPESKAHPGPDWTPVYHDASVTILRNRKAWDRAFFVDQVMPASAQEALDGLRNATFAPHEVALVENIDRALTASLAHASSPATVEVTQPTANSEIIKTTNDYRRLLLISEPFFNGWQAEIDGQPTTIYRADYVLRGVIVPPGTHTITFRYRPTSALAGAGLSSMMVLVLAGLALWRRPQIEGN